MALSIIQTPGGEVRVETGVGTVMKVEDTGKRNVQVTIRADHLDKPVTGWADTHAGLLPAVGERVSYRIDVHRKKSVDAGVPFADLEKHQKVRDLVALRSPDDLSELEMALRATGAPAVASPTATNGTAASSTPPATTSATTAKSGGESANPGGVPTCYRCKESLAGQPAVRVAAGSYRHAGEDCPTDPFDSADRAVDPAALAPAPPSPPVPPRRPRVAEAKPWELYNSDGSLNMGSYAMTAAVGFVELAHRLAAEQAAKRRAEGHTDAVSMGQVKALAKTLLAVADRVQASNRDDGHHDRMDNSHTRARGAVREALWVFPVPWGATAEARAEWIEQLVEHASALMAMAAALHAEYTGYAVMKVCFCEDHAHGTFRLCNCCESATCPLKVASSVEATS